MQEPATFALKEHNKEVPSMLDCVAHVERKTDRLNKGVCLQLVGQ